MSAPDFSVVIPVFNEQESLPALLDRCLAACGQTGRSHELILVDDGSRDQSRDLLLAAAGTRPGVTAVILNRNYGQHAAVFAGMAQSSGQVVITLDADLQNPPEEIPRLLAEVDRGFDVVGTVRLHRQDSLFRRVASACVNHLVRQSTGVMMHDYGCMLRAYSRPVVDAMLQCRERATFIPILANSFAGSASEIPVHHAAREHGVSKYGLGKLLALQLDLLTALSSTLPLRIMTLLGLTTAAGGFGLALLLLVLRLVHGAAWAVDGVFTLFAVLFGFVGMQLLGMGLLGEYIGRLHQDVRDRPRYFVREVCGGQPVPARPDPDCSQGRNS